MSLNTPPLTIQLNSSEYPETLELEKKDGIWYLIIDSMSKAPLVGLTFDEYQGFAQKGKILKLQKIDDQVMVVLADFMMIKRLFIVPISSEYKVSETRLKKNWGLIIARILFGEKKGETHKPPFANAMMNKKNMKYQILCLLQNPGEHHIKR